MFPFFHGSHFPSQGGAEEKCFLFKMSTKGQGSGVDLINRMNQFENGDLKDSWIHFDHTHQVEG